ncbi:hypothetical protein [Peterkaempfera bronchialis]|uniref:hypothetical protein n=1 Tax=Peterkaempfera bronchialis TaxID=2126346 RepID=UPI003C2B3424
MRPLGMYEVAGHRRVIALVERDSAEELDRTLLGRLPLREYLESEAIWPLRTFESFLEDCKESATYGREGAMPLIDFSYRAGPLSDDRLDRLLPRLTKTLMWWEKVPDTERARASSMIWAQEFPAGRTLVGGSVEHDPYYRIDVKIPANRLDDHARAGIVRDFTTLVLTAEGSPLDSSRARRVWVLIRDVPADSWGVSGHRDWLRDYTSALDEISAGPADVGPAPHSATVPPTPDLPPA